MNLSGLALGHQKDNTNGFVAGMSPWNKGGTHSEETKVKIREARSRQENVVVFQAGDKHPNWQGGITPLLKAVRNLDRYVQWRTEIFIRDNRACVECESTEQIEADHIIPLSALLKIFEVQTAAEAKVCDFLFDLTNGRTLCHECHTRTATYAARAKRHPMYVNY